MLSKICIYNIHKEKNVFGNVFQIEYFDVKNISCVIGMCVKKIKKNLRTVLF